jgi:hypothetical protein
MTAAELQANFEHLQRLAVQVHPQAMLRCEEQLLELSEVIVSDAELQASLSSTSEEIGKVRMLVRQAADYYKGWTEHLAMRIAGYTAEGEPAKIAEFSELSIKG